MPRKSRFSVTPEEQEHVDRLRGMSAMELASLPAEAFDFSTDQMKYLRSELGLTQAEVATICRASHWRTVQNWENQQTNQRQVPKGLVELLLLKTCVIGIGVNKRSK